MASTNAKKLVIELLNGSKATTGQYGLSDVYANTDLITDDIFQLYSADERTRIQDRWTETPVKVAGEYSRSNYTAPRIIVLRSSDNERPETLGDYMGLDSASSTADSFREHHTYGTYLDERLSLVIQAAGHGPGQRDDLYLVLRELIIRARQYLISNGMHTLQWRDGRDGDGFRPDKGPHIIHEARATLQYINQLTWTETATRLSKFRSKHQDYGGRVTTQDYSDET